MPDPFPGWKPDNELKASVVGFGAAALVILIFGALTFWAVS